MGTKRGIYRPRIIDRVLFAILGTFHVLGGLYVAGPWYLDQTGGFKSPLYSMFNDRSAVALFGIFFILDGIGLIYGAAAKPGKVYTSIISNSLFIGFLVRLYAVFGTFLILESWRPPSYLANVVTVLALGSYWLWVKFDARPTE